MSMSRRKFILGSVAAGSALAMMRTATAASCWKPEYRNPDQIQWETIVPSQTGSTTCT